MNLSIESLEHFVQTRRASDIEGKAVACGGEGLGGIGLDEVVARGVSVGQQLIDLAGADQAKRAQALSIWQASRPARGTLVETYLASRAIVILPSSIRFHPACPMAGGIFPK